MLATVLGSGMTSIDATVVGVALPTIGRHFHTSVVGLQWVSNAYMLTLAGLLLLGGSLGDRFGRRRLFEIGTVWFALASMMCALAPSAGLLIAGRGLQGVGGALLTPGSLAILQASFSPDDRSKAIGAWAGLSGVATAVGPLVGGWLISAVSWRAIFFINLPIAAAVLFISHRHIPESKGAVTTGHLDVSGAALFGLGLAGLSYGLTEVAGGSTSVTTVGALGCGGALLAAFVVVEAKAKIPMLPLGLFRSVVFSGTNALTFVVYGALSGTLFLLPIQLQQVLGFTPLAAGLSLLPVTAIMLVLSSRSGAFAARHGPRWQLSLGPAVVGAGLALFVRVAQHGNYIVDVLPGALVLGIGLVITVAPLTSTVLAAVPTEHSGVASATNNEVARAAGLLTVAVLPGVAGITGHSYLHPQVFSEGFHRAVLIGAAACFVGALLGFVTLRGTAVSLASDQHAGGA